MSYRHALSLILACVTIWSKVVVRSLCIVLISLYIRVPKIVPLLELFSSNVGTESFQRWKIEFPREENKVSSVGSFSNVGKFLES